MLTRPAVFSPFYFYYYLSSFPFAIVVQNPGRVVTLIHQEDWTSFSGAVGSLCLFSLSLRKAAHTIADLNSTTFLPGGPVPARRHCLGYVACSLASRVTFPKVAESTTPGGVFFFSYFECITYNHASLLIIPPRLRIGIAYTIDPVHATEVRAYLGTY